jgi:hypothetical protein
MPPGSVAVPPSVLVMTRSGAALTGVLSTPKLLVGSVSAPCVPSSTMLTVLLRTSSVDGTGLGTVTANTAEPLPPTARLPTAKRNSEPPTATQPGVLAAALKLAPAGRNSVRTTPVALASPVLEKLIV